MKQKKKFKLNERKNRKQEHFYQQQLEDCDNKR